MSERKAAVHLNLKDLASGAAAPAIASRPSVGAEQEGSKSVSAGWPRPARSCRSDCGVAGTLPNR